MSQSWAQTNDELEIAEAQNSLTDLLYDYAAKAITTRIGQFVYRRANSFLSIAEKTARWSLPQPAPSSESKGQSDEAPDDDKIHISPPPLIRPLPWLLFIPALIYMRLIRSGLSLVALVMGWRPLLPEHVVSWLQNKRRKLRALKYRGQKLDRISRAERKASQANDDEPQTTWLSKITLPLRMVICSRGYGRLPSTVVVRRPHRHQHHRKDSSEEQKSKKRNVKQRDDGDSSSEDSMHDSVNCSELLNRYASDNGDSSFQVADGSSESSDIFSSETEKSALEDEPSKETDPNAANKQSKEAQNGHAKQEKRKSNGNAAPAEQDPKSTKDEEAKPRKSSLNVENGDGKAKAEENGATETGKPGSGGKNVHPANRSKSAASLESEHSAASHESKTSKSTPNLAPLLDGQENIENKPQNQNTSDKQSAGSMSDVKSNFQQKQKQNQNQQHQHQNAHQQQQQHQHQPQQQHQQNHQNQQQQHAAANGGGKKNKRPSHGH